MWSARTASPIATGLMVPSAGWPRTSGSCAPEGGGWSACTPRSRAATARSKRRPVSPATSASASTSTSPRAPSTRTPGSASQLTLTPRGCSCTPSTSMTPCRARSPTTPDRTCTTPWATPVRRARPNPIVLGTDGIGADMLDEFRVAFVRHREDDVTASPDVAWSWLENGWQLVPEARGDVVRVVVRGDGAVAARVHDRRASGRCRGRGRGHAPRRGRDPGRCRRGASEGRRASPPPARAAMTG